MKSDPVDTQLSFYAGGEHAYLRVQPDDHYAAKLARRLAGALGLGPDHHVVELGAGFGRFTFSLLEHCGSVVAVDLSERALGELRRVRDERGISPERLRIHCADADALDGAALPGPVDCVLGFFLLHHLPDFAATISRMAPLLSAGGGMGFLEPNRRNPAYLLQVACCADMDWSSERGMFRLSARGVESAYDEAGLTQIETTRFGLFPPQILNRFAGARRLEQVAESIGLLRPVLPFLLMTARAPHPADPR